VTTHPTKVANLSPKQLAQRVAFLRYDALVDFLSELSRVIGDEAVDADTRGNGFLLMRVSHALAEATQSATMVRDMCKPMVKP
jgi:hypothetical protein